MRDLLGQHRAALVMTLGLAPLLIFVALLVYIHLQVPGFLGLRTLRLVLTQTLPVLLLCAGMSVVVMAGGDDVVSGGIDLSVPATAVLCAGIMAQHLAGDGTVLMAAALGLGAALVVGAINALLVTWVGMTPLLTTLAMFTAALGVNNMITERRRIAVSTPEILWLRDGAIFGLAPGLWIVGLILLAMFFLIHRTRFGARLQAVGGNRDAAEIAGIAVARYVASAFIIAALCGFAASFFVIARGSGISPGIENNLLLQMVLATYLGAAFSLRRVVTLWGAVLGAILVGAMTVGFQSMGVNVFWTGLIQGALVLTVVAFAAQSSRRARA